MRPFKMFFGIAIAVILFSFFIRIAFVAFVAATIMSIVYAIFRRVKDFITYDSYGEPYIKAYRHHPALNYNRHNEVEPLFHESIPSRRRAMNKVQFIETI